MTTSPEEERRRVAAACCAISSSTVSPAAFSSPCSSLTEYGPATAGQLLRATGRDRTQNRLLHNRRGDRPVARLLAGKSLHGRAAARPYRLTRCLGSCQTSDQAWRWVVCRCWSLPRASRNTWRMRGEALRIRSRGQRIQPDQSPLRSGSGSRLRLRARLCLASGDTVNR